MQFTVLNTRLVMSYSISHFTHDVRTNQPSTDIISGFHVPTQNENKLSYWCTTSFGKCIFLCSFRPLGGSLQAAGSLDAVLRLICLFRRDHSTWISLRPQQQKILAVSTEPT